MTYLEHLQRNERISRRMAIMWAILASLNIIPLVLDIIHHDWRAAIPHLTLVVLQVVLALCEYSSMRDQQRLQQLTIQIEALQSSLHKQRTLAEEIEEDESPWISVEDELPPMGDRPYSERVFVRYIERLGDQEYVRYSFDDLLCVGKIRKWCRHETDNEHVTHWMPIPEIEE